MRLLRETAPPLGAWFRVNWETNERGAQPARLRVARHTRHGAAPRRVVRAVEASLEAGGGGAGDAASSSSCRPAVGGRTCPDRRSAGAVVDASVERAVDRLDLDGSPPAVEQRDLQTYASRNVSLFRASRKALAHHARSSRIAVAACSTGAKSAGSTGAPPSSWRGTPRAADELPA